MRGAPSGLLSAFERSESPGLGCGGGSASRRASARRRPPGRKTLPCHRSSCVRLSSVVDDFGQAIRNSAHVPEHGGRITSTSSSVLADADRSATSKREVTNQRLARTRRSPWMTRRRRISPDNAATASRAQSESSIESRVLPESATTSQKWSTVFSSNWQRSRSSDANSPTPNVARPASCCSCTSVSRPSVRRNEGRLPASAMANPSCRRSRLISSTGSSRRSDCSHHSKACGGCLDVTRSALGS